MIEYKLFVFPFFSRVSLRLESILDCHFLPLLNIFCLKESGDGRISPTDHMWLEIWPKIISMMRSCRSMNGVPPSGVYAKSGLDLRSIFSAVLDAVADGTCGAVAFFVGVVKSVGVGEKDVNSLVMESYPEHADKALRKICDEVAAEYRLRLVGVWHLIGEFEVGEAVVLVAVAGLRRKDVLAALQTTVERYKREPALFKKEVYVDGSHSWIEGA
jgi:molybdopterin synthase catalytic subunit